VGWKRKINRQVPKRHDGTVKNFSISKKLKSELKINEEFEIMLASLSLEEIIALKLELAAKAVNGYMYGIPIWYTLPTIVKDAVLKFSFSAARSKKEAARFLGIDIMSFNNLVNNYRIKSFFEKKDD
tara:strand:- start:188 stop:568 length:381 start_codon:yes stop_codon:yes gene_type:complete